MSANEILETFQARQAERILLDIRIREELEKDTRLEVLAMLIRLLRFEPKTVLIDQVLQLQSLEEKRSFLDEKSEF